MSTPEQEYEEAVEIVAEDLNYGIVADLERGWTPWHELDEHGRNWHRKAARSLLSLTWPCGQPMIGVLAKDQSFRALTALMPPERKIGFDLAVGEMKEAGFRRVVKQEAK